MKTNQNHSSQLVPLKQLLDKGIMLVGDCGTNAQVARNTICDCIDAS